MRRDNSSIDDSTRLIDRVHEALIAKRPLRIRGGNSKVGLGRSVIGDELDVRSHRGVVNYDASELVITARAGTPLDELNAILDVEGQMLACESPTFGGIATVGGMVASGLSGPRRPWSGSVRDFLLGCRIITGEAKHLRFGGQVMKNVAGYDVSRLMAGGFGCLGVITEVSLKVLPKPRATQFICMEMDTQEALEELGAWRRAALPVTGACYLDGHLHIRLEGGEGSVRAATDRIGGEKCGESLWESLREQRLPFFTDPRPLWRLSLPSATPCIELPGDILLDWGGAQRWLKSNATEAEIRHVASAFGGHATCFSPNVHVEPFHPLPAPLLRYHQQLKQRLDPHGLFNPGRMYPNL